jgi:DNA (cytosine-5)-methyltransferase 1
VKGHNQRRDATALTGALLPSPRTSDTNGAGLHGDGGLDLRTAVTLLPTPVVTDAKGARNSTANRSETARPHAVGDTLGDLVFDGRLLPTPMVGSTSPAAHGQISGDFRAKMDDALTRFGQYAPAIARWESTTGLPAPSPTEPTGRGGAHRLSPRFTEWMMGLPAGWITDVPDVTRNEALKLCGNGVVQQQAFAAICDALHAWAEAAA